jgi:hypothetical protein
MALGRHARARTGRPEVWRIVTRDGRSGAIVGKSVRGFATLEDGAYAADGLIGFLRSTLAYALIGFVAAGPVLPDCYGDLYTQRRLTVSTFEINGRVLHLNIEREDHR